MVACGKIIAMTKKATSRPADVKNTGGLIVVWAFILGIVVLVRSFFLWRWRQPDHVEAGASSLGT